MSVKTKLSSAKKKTQKKLSKTFNSRAFSIGVETAWLGGVGALTIGGIVAGAPLTIAFGGIASTCAAILLADDVLKARGKRPIFAEPGKVDNSYQWSDIGNAFKNAPAKAKNKVAAAAKKLKFKN